MAKTVVTALTHPVIILLVLAVLIALFPNQFFVLLMLFLEGASYIRN